MFARQSHRGSGGFMARRRSLMWVTVLSLSACALLSLWRLAGVHDTTGISLRAAVGATPPEPVFVCPKCEDLFTKLDRRSKNHKGKQEIGIQLRGEPKSGTGMMSSWAVGAMVRTCELLENAFGTGSCRIEPVDGRDAPGAVHEWTLIFEPRLSAGDEKCSCDSVDRVRIKYSNLKKHTLPVDIVSCPWSHVNGIPSYDEGCTTFGERSEPVTNYAELRSCMQESPCKITDHRLQFSTFRDPRAVAVSTYFWIETHAKDVAVYAKDRVGLDRTLDESILEILENVCRWTTTRHILFKDLMQDGGTVFSYEEAEGDPLDWHYRWTHLAGLHLPVPWVEDLTTLATKGAWASLTQGVNPHPGGLKADERRSWREEVSPELLDQMDAVVRRWLPRTLLARIGVPFEPVLQQRQH